MTMNDEFEKLKPCPICGNKDLKPWVQPLDVNNAFCFYVECNCGLSFDYYPSYPKSYVKSMKEGIEAWNKRYEPTVDPIEAEPNELGIYGLPQCPVCHSSLDRGSRYCSWCGAKLSHPIGG